MPSDPEPLPNAVIVAYGLPGLIAAIPVIPVAVILPSWYAGDLGLGFLLTGIALGAARVVDFGSDLLVGMLSDRFEWRGYRYKIPVIAGAAIAILGLYLLAQPPADVGPLWLAFASIVLFSGWTLLMVPYTAWGAELSPSVHVRTQLTASREFGGLVGTLTVLILPALAIQMGLAPSVSPLSIVAMSVTALGIPAIVVFSRTVPEPKLSTLNRPIGFRDIGALVRLRAFRRSLACWFLNGIANGLPAVLFPIVVRDYFGFSDEQLYLLLACYFGGAIVMMPVWLASSKRLGKVSTWMLAIGVNVFVFAQVLLLEPTAAAAFVVICIASGTTLGADLSLPPSIQADILAHDRDDSGRRRTATAFACWSMATKLALACAIVIGFAGLAAGSVESNEPLSRLQQHLLLGLYVVVPVGLKVVVVLLLRRLRRMDVRSR